MSRFRVIWSKLFGSLWFVPALIVLASMVAAVVLVEAQGRLGDDLAADWPRLFGAGAEGSRAMLSSIATSMVTVAGVVLSITIVTLSLSATQYSPRILRNFMRDRPTQWVLGIFMGVFAYCLLVLRTVRADDELRFIPSLAVLGGMAYALVGIGFLIFFIHHVAQSIQASSIAARIHEDTAAAIDRLYPEGIGSPATPEQFEPVQQETHWLGVPAGRSGYVIAVDADGVMSLAVQCDRLLRLEVRVGDFVGEGSLLASFAGVSGVDQQMVNALRSYVLLGGQRTVEQDAAYGLQQLVDVAVKALSPGINDPSTACLCIDQLGTLMWRLASRHLPSPFRSQDGQLRVIAPGPDFSDLLQVAFEAVIHHSRDDVQVADHLLNALETIAQGTDEPARRSALAKVVRDVQTQLRTVKPRYRASVGLSRARALRRQFSQGRGSRRVRSQLF